ncbi:nitroreductase family deazaflavin-dependent oxidoreductase [Lacisediminihabitans profunda]|uniref:Nitroreductase family deazaflavin-dependent oxidoreductase n=1 Tax=Lacisediminihabitans profunda TaxID=2594790 RepID=A0A5C8UL54_9MICO|nr:nitroreductase family deazaflavin-dependent oxidoreductase [Lacisediminihabitans profunda]TXN28996.1 nitroreductase family deazaflavin-dependent oxidoreductase [Lacisediminihabitans profunda]
MGLGSKLRIGWLYTINHSLNRLTGRWARQGSEHFSIVRTVGRKSGKTFETPIIVRPIEGGFVCELTYGPEVNWYRNLVAANGGEIVHNGVTTKIVGLEPMTTAEGIAAFTPFQRRVLRMLKRTHFVKLIAA